MKGGSEEGKKDKATAGSSLQNHKVFKDPSGLKDSSVGALRNGSPHEVWMSDRVHGRSIAIHPSPPFTLQI